MKRQMSSYFYLGASLLAGLAITGMLYFQSLKQESDRNFGQFNAAGDVFGNTFDLMISNQVIRLQNFEESIEEDVVRGPQRISFIHNALKNSVFSTFSVFQINGFDDQGIPDFARVSRIEIPNGKMPPFVPTSSRLQSKTSLIVAKQLIKTGTKFYPFITVRDGVVLFVVAWHSTLRPKNFYFVTGPAMGLFENSLHLDHGTKVLLHQKIDSANFSLEKGKTGEILIQEISDDLYNSDVSKAIAVRKLPGNYSRNYFDLQAVSLEDTHPDNQTLIVLLSGLIITLLISLLIFFLVNRNMAIKRVVHERTADLIVESNKAKEATYVKTRFLANISHEIRSPLNIILGMSDLLKETGPTTRQTQYIENLQTSGNHLLNLMNDILEMARVDSNDVPFKHSEFSTIEFMEQVARLIYPSVEKKNLHLYLNFDTRLPTMIETDPGRLRQILINLLNNAVKFTDSGYIRLEASVIPVDKSFDSQKELEFKISDSGSGIPAESQADIFKAFYQVNPSLTRLKGGVGLGLSIVQAIVARFNGKIELQTTGKVGSTFAVRIPIATPDSRPWTSNFEVSNLKAKILFLTEDEANNNQIQSLMDAFGLSLDIVGSSHMDIEAIVDLSKKYDFILVGKLNCKKNLEASGVLSGPKIIELREPILPRELLKSLGVRNLIKSDVTEGPEELSPTDPNASDLSLLIVDDDPSNRILMQAYLKEQKWRVRYAKSGEEALDLCSEVYPDILITDLQMPTMDGFTLIAGVREMTKENKFPKNPKFVILTADAQPETAAYAKSTDIDFYLTKPIRKKDLLDTIRRLRYGNATIQ